MSEEYTRSRLPSGWSVLIEKNRLKSELSIIDHCSSLCLNNFNSNKTDNQEDLCLKRCFNKSLSFMDFFKAECEDLHIKKSKELMNIDG